jgi:RimJ/RimL family protein N-acetyltransferase
MITTDRLVLRPHRTDDFEQLLTLYRDKALNEFIRGLPASEEDSWNRLLRYIGHWSAMDYGLFAVIDRTENKIIGEVGFADFRRGLGAVFDSCPEAAWMFRGASHGQGYALEAMTAAIRWFDAMFEPDKTVCIIDPHNLGSIRLAAKLGFEAFGASMYRGAAVTMLARRQNASPR